MTPLLTVAIPTYNDYRGVSMTVQSLRLHHNKDFNVLVFDNFGCQHTKDFCKGAGVPYIVDDRIQGTAYAKSRAIGESDSRYVLVIDSHVQVNAVGLCNLQGYLSKLPYDNKDIFHGCLVDGTGKISGTEMSPLWRNNMWGAWHDRTKGGTVALPEEGFEVWGHGCALFCVNKSMWPGYHPRTKGFGGEEGCIQARYRDRGGKAITLPFLRWTHSFNNCETVKHVVTAEDPFRNYLLNLAGMKKSMQYWCDCILHFSNRLSMDRIREIAAECLPSGMEITNRIELAL